MPRGPDSYLSGIKAMRPTRAWDDHPAGGLTYIGSRESIIDGFNTNGHFFRQRVFIPSPYVEFQMATGVEIFAEQRSKGAKEETAFMFRAHFRL